MATTDQVRGWYSEWVTNHADRGKPGFKPRCQTIPSVVVDFPRLGGGVWRLPVHARCAEAFDAYAHLMRHHGVAMAPAGGVHNCRNIAGTNMPSLHAYGVCIDLPPNDYKPAPFQRDVLAVRTKSGVRVWRNLADANDRMHDQIDCSPADLASGIDWTTVAGYTPDPLPPVPPAPVEVLSMLPIRYGDGYLNPPDDAKVSGDRTHMMEMVRWLQESLNIAYGARISLADGKYGPETAAAVAEFTARYTGHPEKHEGTWFGGRQFANVQADVARAVVPPGGAGGDVLRPGDTVTLVR